MINITVTGADGVQQTLARILPASEDAILRLAERVHELAYQGADRHTKTGALIRSLGHGPKRIFGGWEIGHDLQAAKHAIFVHWGSRPHVIRPKNKKALRWASGNGFAFAKFVNHPGYRGDPYLTNAATRALSEFDAIVQQSMRDI